MPRSPSRDLSDRFIGKRGYFRNPDALRRGKYALAAAAFLAAVGWAAIDVFQPARAAYAHSHGPLASPHAAFDDNCAACHVGHSPDFNPLSLFSARDRWHDLSCGKCHAGPDNPGFAHHASANAKANEFHNRCSNCHHDHNGRLNSLVRLSDADCNQCHADLGKWHDAAKSKAGTPYQNTITSFATDHPEFRSLDIVKTPRTLTFSHAVHMNPGQAYKGGGEAMTVERVRKLGGDAAVARYTDYKPGGDENALVQLQCSSCHQLDPGTGTPAFANLKTQLDALGEPTRALLPPRADGAYFLPLNYEVSCRSCHPLVAPAGVSAGKPIERFGVPHRKQPAQLAEDLKAGYLKGMIATKHPALAAPPEPGGKLDTSPAANRTLSDEATRLASVAERVLLTGDAGCAKCHAVSAPKTAGAKFRVEPVPDRTAWFKHAKFNHAAHRGATCATCHPGTGAAAISPADAKIAEPTQILGVESCRACHSPAGTPVKLPNGSTATQPDGTKGALPDGTKVAGGGVRAACTDCHRYHHGDLPLQGRGAADRYPKDPRTLADWLKGK